MSTITFTTDISNQDVKILLRTCKQDNIVADIRQELYKRINEYRSLGPTVAARIDETVLGIGGIGQIHTGVGHAWLILSNKFLVYPKSLLSMCKQLINESFVGMNFHRIQMDIDSSFSENAKFADKLGFKCEGIMENYGPNKEDYYRYVRFKE